MQFLLSFVGKDKWADGLMERLLTRISLSTSLKQRRNLSFCVGELNITDKGIKRMVELIKVVKDALYDDKVFENIKNCVAKAKKNSRFGSAAAGGAGAGAPEENAAATQAPPAAEGAAATAGAGSAKELKASITELEQILEKIRNNSLGNTTEGDDMDIDASAPATAMDDAEEIGETDQAAIKGKFLEFHH